MQLNSSQPRVSMKPKLNLFPMKKLLLGLLVFQFFIFAANAQIEKGSIMLGGSVNFNNSNSEELSGTLPDVSAYNYDSHDFLFNPRFGYSIGNNWVIGTALAFNKGKITRKSASSTSSSSTMEEQISSHDAFGAALFARKYFPLGDKFSVFGELISGANWRNVNFRSNSSQGTSSENETKYTEYQTTLSAGLAYFPKNWLALELSTNLVSFTTGEQNQSSRKYDSFSFGLNTSSINLGVSFFLNNK